MAVQRLVGGAALQMVVGCWCWISVAVAQSPAVLAGRVTAREGGTPLAGVRINLVLADTTLHTLTGDSGQFLLANVPRGTHAVTLRSDGYRSLTKQILVDRDSNQVDFQLEAQPLALREVVTTAAGPRRRQDLGHAIATIAVDSVMQTAPVQTVTDLLEARVPGLTVQHTTGAPGDPSRLWLRGSSSVLRNTDPVVIVDGVRIYAAQSEARSGNLTNLDPATDTTGVPRRIYPFDVPSPSPLDQIDPNIIEKIEVFNGPSAATLYGADAANGVIVITTKRGQPGPARWQASLTHGRTASPGRYPTATFRWGHDLNTDATELCVPFDVTCIQDSVVAFQALNDPALSLFDHGQQTGLSLATSGGSRTLTYSVAGFYSNERGPLALPAVEMANFRTVFSQDPPSWMQRPQQLERWSVTSRISAHLGATADVTWSTMVSQAQQRRSSLEQQLASLMGTYVDAIDGIYYRPNPSAAYLWDQTSNLVSGYYIKQTAATLAFTNALTADWRPRSWVGVQGTAGLDLVSRADGLLLPAGLVSVTDSGARVEGTGRSLVGTFNLQGDVHRPLGAGFEFSTSAGANLTTDRTDDLVNSAVQLIPGTNAITNAAAIYGANFGANTSVYGWWVEPRVASQRFSLSAGLRLDGGSTYGPAGRGLGRLVSLPKLNASWLISEEPWFPFHALFSSLRMRGAYGQAQVQPGVTDRLRLYADTGTAAGSQLVLATVGNTDIRPERSKELEGGVDADLLNGRVSLTLTAYGQRQVDALLPVQLPPSIQAGGFVLANVGEVRNTGLEMTLGVTPIRSAAVTWTAQLQYARNRNRMITLGEGVAPDSAHGLVAGYPIYSRWARPIVGYSDQNGDGILQPDEVQVGDSLAYVGPALPTYTASLFSNVVLFGGAVGLSAGFSYDDGATQVDQTARENWVLQPALGNPNVPLSEQAAAVASTRPTDPTDFGLIHKVSTFRFQSLSVQYRVPPRVARWVRAQQLAIALQGSNLARHSTYQGRDPNVSAWTAGQNVVDAGQLPMLRRWQVALRLTY